MMTTFIKNSKATFVTKIRASRILMTAGIQSVICSGEKPDALVRLARGESVGRTCPRK